jgi:hypothetical protein
MSTWAVGSITYSDPDSLHDGGGWVAGKYWHDNVQVGHRQYERKIFSYPGVNGLAVKHFGYRGRMIQGSVIYLASTLAALLSAIESDRTVLNNVTFTSTLPDGSTLPNCQLEALDDGEISPSGNGLILMRTHLQLRQLRD